MRGLRTTSKVYKCAIIVTWKWSRNIGSQIVSSPEYVDIATQHAATTNLCDWPLQHQSSFELVVYITALYKVLKEQNCDCLITTKEQSPPFLISCLLLPSFLSLCAALQSEPRWKICCQQQQQQIAFSARSGRYLIQLSLRSEESKTDISGENEAWPEPLTGSASFSELRWLCDSVLSAYDCCPQNWVWWTGSCQQWPPRSFEKRCVSQLGPLWILLSWADSLHHSTYLSAAVQPPTIPTHTSRT